MLRLDPAGERRGGRHLNMIEYIKRNWIVLSVTVILLIVFIVVLASASSDAVVGLLGVLIGAGITILYQHFNSISERRHQLRLAALDKRLEVHQKAFSLWREIIKHLHDESDVEINAIVLRCQDWWESNCLYLTPDARKAFSQAYHSVSLHRNAVRTNDSKNILKFQDEIMKAANVIVRGVELPTVAEDESKIVSSRSDT